MKGLSFASLVLVTIAFGAIGWPLFQALPRIVQWSYLSGLPLDLGRAGGVAPLIQSTVVVLSVSVAGALILGMPLALSLARQEKIWIRSILDLLAGTPSIIFGLLGHALFVQALGLGYSLLSGGLTLTCMILPFFVRVLEDALRQIPPEYESISRSLGFSESSYSLKILIPMARSAVATGLVLGWMRAAAETAALLFTAGYSIRKLEGLGLLDSGRPLSVHIFELSMNIANGDKMAWNAASLLMVISFGFVLVLRLPLLARKIFREKIRNSAKSSRPGTEGWNLKEKF